MTTTLGQSTTETHQADAYERVIDNLDANFGAAPTRRAAHAKGVVLTGAFTPSPDAASISRALHLNAGRVPVVARFSSFPGGLATVGKPSLSRRRAGDTPSVRSSCATRP